MPRERLDPELVEASSRTAGPEIGGAIVFLIGLAALAEAIFVLIRMSADPDPPGFVNSFVVVMFYIELAASPIAILGGVMGIMRQYYLLAVIGGLVSVFVGLVFFYIIGAFVGLIGLGLMSVASAEFKSKSHKDEAFETLMEGDARPLQTFDEPLPTVYDAEPLVPIAPEKQNWIADHWKGLAAAAAVAIVMLATIGLVNTQPWSRIQVTVTNGDAYDDVYLAVYVDGVLKDTSMMAAGDTRVLGVYSVCQGMHVVGLDVNYTEPNALDGRIDTGYGFWVGLHHTKNVSFHVNPVIML